jgi:SecD/SecF fusion protein
MQSKGIVRFFLIALTIVCLYQYLLIWPTSRVEKAANEFAHESIAKNPNTPWRTFYSQYLDSMSTETVFSIPMIKKFNYADLKKSQLAMGLDLKGGMSVVLQVDLKDFLKSLSAKSEDPAFLKSLDDASEAQKTQQADYITLFKNAWAVNGGGRKLSSIFARNESLKGEVNFETNDTETLRVVREKANQTVGETYKRLKQRIDKLGVVQPNVSLDANRDLINVELPGIDNPKRVRDFLTGSAKLEFWETFRLSDEGIAKGLGDADLKLLAGGGEIAKDTTYEFPVDANGNVDSTKAKVMKLVEKKAGQGPLLTNLMVNGGNGGETAILGYADKNKMNTINAYFNRPDIKQLFPADCEFRWGQKPVSELEGGVGSSVTGKYELYAIRKARGVDEAPLDGSVVTNASEQPDPRSGEVTVSLQMNNQGAKKWADLTTKAAQNKNREIAILLDDEVVSAPRVINPIEGGSSQITGNFTIEEARDLSNILEVGKLPAQARIVQESQVGPSLGAENINKSLITMILAVVMLGLFMIAYYAKGGVIAVIALLTNIFFIFGTLASVGTVLTLPGIAGIVLTLAAAVDASVVIYERIREELRNGLPKATAISTGFRRALSAILDANVTTILTAFVLMYFGLGPIKGFGTVLLVGIICSLFTAILVARLITEMALERGTDITYSRPWSETWLVGINYDWIGKRKYAYMFSAAIITIGLVSFMMRGFELGVDFKGGNSFNVQFDKPVDLEALKTSLGQSFGANPIVKAVNTENTYNITTSYRINEVGEEITDDVVAKLHDGISKAGFASDITNFKKTESVGTHIVSSSQVGPTVADDISASSFKSAFWALLLIFLFLTIRFRKWQFSLGAVLALLHDVLITLTFFTLLHGIVPFSLEIDQAIIACILTVIGFSVNDTVIVYDRIREFITTFAGRPKEEVFNRAINTTLSRTLITSGTVFMVVLLLFLFGGSAIKGFAFGMLMGIFFGTYSSVFVASALVVDLTKEKVLSGKETIVLPPATTVVTPENKRTNIKTKA